MLKTNIITKKLSKKFSENLIFLFYCLSVITYFFLLLETKFYKGLILNKLGISADVFFIISIFFGVGIVAFLTNYPTKKKTGFSPIFFKINLYLSPLIFLVYIVLLTIEGLNYQNYVLAFFRINLAGLYYFLIFSLFLSIYYLLAIKPNFKFFKKLCLFLPIIFIAMIYLQTWAWYAFWLLPVEDGPIEYSQFVFYLISTVLVIKTSFILRKINKKASKFYLFVALGLFFIAMEEISWGQHILGFKTFEAIKEINLQGELTIHNLAPLRKFLHLSYMIVSFIGAFLWLITSKAIKLRDKLWAKLLVPPPFLFTLFIFTFLYYFYITFLNIFIIEHFNLHLFPNHGWQEIAELSLSLAFLIFFSLNYQKNRKLSIIK